MKQLIFQYTVTQSRAFNDSIFKNKLLDNGILFLNDYLANHGTASEILTKQITKL